MASGFGTINTNGGGFNLPQKIDDAGEESVDVESEREFNFDNQYQQAPPDRELKFDHQYPQQPFRPFQYSPSLNEQFKLLGDGDNKMYFITLFIAFIIGFLIGKTMQPIIIRST